MTYILTFVYDGKVYVGKGNITEPCTTKEQWENAAEGVLLSIIEENGLPRRGTYYNVCLIDPANGKMVWNEEVYTPISKKVD